MNENEKLIKVLQHYNIVDNCICEKMKIICPFHGDVNASLLVDLKTGTFHCFGCGKHGDALKFIENIEQVNRLQAMIKLERICNNCNKSKNNLRILPVERLTSEQAVIEAKRYFYSLPQTNWHKNCAARQYMLDRGFNISTLKRIGARENFNGDYGIVFPIKENGKFCGYVCRATNKETEQKRKYLYNTGFSRRNTLFGNYRHDFVVIVEGPMDYFKMRQFNIVNTVAILGWKITDKQIEKIKRYTNNVISALDNTDTGKQGTEYLRQFFNVVRLQYAENIKDVGDMDIYDFNKSWRDTLYKAQQQGFDV